MEYTKEQFRKQVEIGLEYVAKNNRATGEMPFTSIVNSLTDHLWGTIGMLLQKRGDRREYIYNEPARVDGDEIEGEDVRIR